MRKICILFIFMAFMGLAKTTQAQSYGTALGLRATYWWGLTVKHNFSDVAAVEGILNTRWGGWIVTGLYEHHFPAFGQDGLRWYLGAGGHIGFWGDRYNNGNYWFRDDQDARMGIGLDLIGGIEYTLPSIPLNFSLDLKPGFNLVPRAVPFGDDGAFSIRYCF